MKDNLNRYLANRSYILGEAVSAVPIEELEPSAVYQLTILALDPWHEGTKEKDGSFDYMMRNISELVTKFVDASAEDVEGVTWQEGR